MNARHQEHAKPPSDPEKGVTTLTVQKKEKSLNVKKIEQHNEDAHQARLRSTEDSLPSSNKPKHTFTHLKCDALVHSRAPTHYPSMFTNIFFLHLVSMIPSNLAYPKRKLLSLNSPLNMPTHVRFILEMKNTASLSRLKSIHTFFSRPNSQIPNSAVLKAQWCTLRQSASMLRGPY